VKPEDIEVEICGKFGVTPFLSEDGSAGYDISLPENAGCVVMPYNSRRLIDTGVIFRPPEKCWMLLVLRSSSRKKNVRLSNIIGVIDPSYNGPTDHLCVDLSRDGKKKRYLGSVSKETVHDDEALDATLAEWGVSRSDILTTVKCEEDGEFHYYVEDEDDYLVFRPGEKFCQVIFLPFYRADLVETKLEDWHTEDSRGGLGSTGAFASDEGGDRE